MKLGGTLDRNGERPAQHSSNATLLDFSALSDREAVVPVGGWLLYFCVAFTIFVPLAFFRNLEHAHTPWLIAIYGTIAFTHFMTGAAMWSTSRHVFWTLWAALLVRATYIVFQVGIALIMASRMERGISDATSKELWAAVGNTAGLVTTFLYFRLSRRVLRTYGRNL